MDADPPDPATPPVEPAADALAERLFGPEPKTVPGHWYIGNSGGWQWAPAPEEGP